MVQAMASLPNVMVRTVLRTAVSFPVNTYTSSSQDTPAITSLADGGFVITWQSSNQDGSGYGIYGQRYDKDGNTAGAGVRANSYTSGEQNTPDVTSLLDGGFVITWMDARNSNDIYTRL